ncbi:MAG: hypothetical protein IT501_01265 [Rubrivivax sp.]|nr:hypothetical protein [Rubrivivax sp.]
MRQDLLDDRPLEDGRDDLLFPGAAVWAGVHIDIEDPLEQPRPADALRLGLNRLDHQRAQPGVRRQHAVKPDQVQPRPQRARLLCAVVEVGQVGLLHLLNQHTPARAHLHQPGHD